MSIIHGCRQLGNALIFFFFLVYMIYCWSCDFGVGAPLLVPNTKAMLVCGIAFWNGMAIP